jgi:hypothetical protein
MTWCLLSRFSCDGCSRKLTHSLTGSICNVVSSIIIVLIVISRAYAWGDTWEPDLIACASVVMFSNVLNIVTPFKFIGVSCNPLSRALQLPLP